MSKKNISFVVADLIVVLLILNWVLNTIEPNVLEMDIKPIFHIESLDHKGTYWIALLLTIVPTFLLGFLPFVKFQQYWKHVFPSIILTALLYLIWDYFFTSFGVWGFNEAHYIGPLILGMPLEEILFFIFIPYACFLIYLGLKKYVTFKGSVVHIVSLVLSAFSAILAFVFWDQCYTFTTLIIQAGLFFHLYVHKPPFTSHLFFSIAVSVIPFLIINGILTGMFTASPVVLYHPDEYLGIRIGTIPINDMSYQFGMMTFNVLFYEWFSKKD